MHPVEIAKRIGPEKLEAILSELNTAQLKSVLKAGGLPHKTPPAVVTPSARRRHLAKRAARALEQENAGAAGELFYQWLLHRRRKMLADYLTRLGVKHVNGETEESFTKTVPRDHLLQEARALMSHYDPQDVAIYVMFLDHHQESDVFTNEGTFLKALEG